MLFTTDTGSLGIVNSHISTLDSCFGCISSLCLFLLTGRCVTSCHESWDQARMPTFIGKFQGMQLSQDTLTFYPLFLPVTWSLLQHWLSLWSSLDCDLSHVHSIHSPLSVVTKHWKIFQLSSFSDPAPSLFESNQAVSTSGHYDKDRNQSWQ